MKAKIKIKTAVIIMLIGLMTVAGYAYLADIEATKVNEISAGYNEIELVEKFRKPGENVKAGTDIPKIVQIKNGTESVECYVRCFAEFEYNYQEERYDVDFNTNDWEKSGEYWYYKKPLGKGEITTPLQTRLRTKYDERFPVFEQIIYAESVQAAGYSNAYDAFASINTQ